MSARSPARAAPSARAAPAARAALAALALGVLQAGSALAGEDSIQLKSGPGRELTAARCAICHSLDYLEMNAPVMNQASWQKDIRKMVDRFGAPVTEDESRQILEYLTANYAVPVTVSK